MKNQKLVKYKPRFKLIDDGELLFLFREEVPKVESIVLEEATSNLIGDLLLGVLFVVLPVFMTIYGVDFSNTQSKIFGIGIGLLMFFGGIILVFESFKRLTNTKYRSRLIMDKEGVQLHYTKPTSSGKYAWSEIKEIALKVFPNKFSGEPYLLMITQYDQLVDVDLSLLKKEGTKFLDKEEWEKTLKIKSDNFKVLRGCIQHYFELDKSLDKGQNRTA